MKKIFVQKQIVGWEQYTFEVDDDFENYESLIDSQDWVDWEYLEDETTDTGVCEILDEEGNTLYEET